MAFTNKDVMALREKTGVGMMDCKKALQESDGDVEKAIDYLREKGLAKQAKKASRVAAEGMAYATVDYDKKVGVVLSAVLDIRNCPREGVATQRFTIGKVISEVNGLLHNKQLFVNVFLIFAGAFFFAGVFFLTEVRCNRGLL